MAMPVESSNKSLRPLLTAGGAGVGDGAKVLGTDEGMKFCPTYSNHNKYTHAQNTQSE